MHLDHDHIAGGAHTHEHSHDHDHDGDKPEGRLAKEEDDDRPDTDIPLHSASPWPKRALKSPRRTLPTFFLP